MRYHFLPNVKCIENVYQKFYIFRPQRTFSLLSSIIKAAEGYYKTIEGLVFYIKVLHLKMHLMMNYKCLLLGSSHTSNTIN